MKYLSIAFLVVVCGGMMWAQTTRPPLRITKSDTATFFLEGMEVRAARAPLSVFELPMAVSVVTPEVGVVAPGTGLSEVLSLVPGVFVQSRAGSQDLRITIRGFGARGAGERSNAGTSRGIRFLLDGFPATEPDGRTAFDLFDASGAGRVEILRSNASALYGSASGGVINLVSRTEYRRPELNLQSSFGDFGYHAEALRYGTPVGGGGMFFTLTNSVFDGWRAHSRSTRTLMNTGIQTDLDARTRLGVYATATTSMFRIPGPLTPSQYDADPSQAQADTATYNPTYVQRDERRLNRQGRLGAVLTHHLSDDHLIHVTGYAEPKVLQRSERNTYRDFTRYHVGGSASYTGRFDLSAAWAASVQAGVDEQYQDGAILFYDLKNGGRGTTLKDNKREGANVLGAFGQAEIELHDSWILAFGGRYDKVSYLSESYIGKMMHEVKTFEHFSPKAGLTWRIDPLFSVYLGVGGGIEVPAGNETDPASTYGEDTLYVSNPLLEPVTSTTMEVGVKHQLLYGEHAVIPSVAYDLAAFFIQSKNDFVPYRGGRFYLNAAETRRYGIEAAIEVDSRWGLSLTTAFTVMHAEYSNYTIDSVHYSKTKAGHFADLSGNRLVGVPDYTVSARLRYVAPFFTPLYVEVGAQGVGEYYADDANTLSVPAYAVVDARIGLRDLVIPGTPLRVDAGVGLSNVADTKYISSAFLNPDVAKWSGEAIYIEPGLPRNVQGSVTLRWLL